MGISLKTHKLLWGKSGNRCAFSDCRIELVIDESETDDPSLIGEESHIIGRKDDGPRGKSDLTEDERDRYDNLILLCRVHHKVIDDQEKKYTVEILHGIKTEHEKWVKTNLAIDIDNQKDDLLYASYVDRFVELAEIDHWKDWTSFVFSSGQPSIHQNNLNKLRELINYIISRVWPNRYPELEKAFNNLKNTANDFINVFDKHSHRPSESLNDESQDHDDRIIWTEKFYHINEWNPERYDALFQQYEYHCFLVEDLALEMTRAANYLFDQVRRFLFPAFRIEQGVLLIEIGPFMDLSYQTIRVEYKSNEKQVLYPGLRMFMEIRKEREYFRGEGTSEDYFRSIY